MKYQNISYLFVFIYGIQNLHRAIQMKTQSASCLAHHFQLQDGPHGTIYHPQATPKRRENCPKILGTSQCSASLARARLKLYLFYCLVPTWYYQVVETPSQWSKFRIHRAKTWLMVPLSSVAGMSPKRFKIRFKVLQKQRFPLLIIWKIVKHFSQWTIIIIITVNDNGHTQHHTIIHQVRLADMSRSNEIDIMPICVYK